MHHIQRKKKQEECESSIWNCWLRNSIPTSLYTFRKKRCTDITAISGFFDDKTSRKLFASIWKLKEGAIADIVLIDLETEQEIDAEEFAIKRKKYTI